MISVESSTNSLPFEIHVTVRSGSDQLEKFKLACHQSGVKPIVLDLQNSNGETLFHDVMTSSVCVGDNRDAYEEMQRISNALKSAGFEVIRGKIETVPWHPAAPSEKHGRIDMPLNCYFEAHFSIVADNESLLVLRKIAEENNAHLSRNVFKNLTNGKFKIMSTYRDYKSTVEKFAESTSNIRAKFEEAGFELDKHIIEFAIYDSNLSHDSRWIKGDINV